MTAPRLRIDKWLYHARFFKSRTLAAKFCNGGYVRVNAEIIKKAHVLIGPEDFLTFAKGDQVKVVKIKGLGKRRGPAPEAQALYEDLSPSPEKKTKSLSAPPAYREPGQGRPTKSERRALDRLKETE